MPYTDEKIGLRAGVDVNGVPTGFQWDVLRRFTDDEGNALGETRTSVAVTDEELAAHISAALVAQATDIANFATERNERDAAAAAALAAVAAQRDAAFAELEQLTVAHDALADAFQRVKTERDALLAAQAAPE